MGGPLQKYRYRGTVLKLNDADAARLGLGEDDLVDTRARGEHGPETIEPPDGPAKAVAEAANKARVPALTKGGRGRRKPPAATEGDGAGGTPPDSPEPGAAGAGDGSDPSGPQSAGDGASGGGGGD